MTSGGGGGGAGGYGAIVTGGGASSNTSTITGGNGGAGGGGFGSAASSGNGGVGGVGVQFTASGATFTNSGTVTGGDGGAGGTGSGGAAQGNPGAGGGGIVGSGLTIINSGTITGGLSGDGSTAANAITFTGGTNLLELQAGSNITGKVVAFSAADTLALGGTASSTFDVSQIGAAAQYQGFGLFVKTGTSTWTLTGTTAAVTPWAINGGTLAISSDGNLGGAAGGLSFNGGTLQFLAGFTSNRAVTLSAGGGTFDTNGNNATLAGTIGGGGGLTKIGAGTLTLTGANSYTGGTTINGGSLVLGNGGTSGSIVGDVVDNGILAFNRSDSATFGGLISGTGAVHQIGTGTTVLTGVNTYAGATVVNAGSLIVNGSIAASSGLTVDAGALVGGNGTLPTTVINGTLSPGNSIGTITVAGSLTFGAGGVYAVEVSPTAADRTNVTGTATLAGIVQATFATGSYVANRYTILHADGGLGGTTFGGLATVAMPTALSAALSYDPNNVYLNLTAALGLGTTLPGNPQAVATAINGYFNNGGALPPGFLPLFGLSGTSLSTALSQLSGEATTGAQQAALQLGNQFFALMLDPYAFGRGAFGAGGIAGGPLALASEDTLPPEIALAYAKVMKAPPIPVPVTAPQWSAWGGAYGGSGKIAGDALAGSNDLSARTGGFAAGMDYRVAPGTVLGFALGGGFTNWDLAAGLGGGSGDAVQAGVYGVTKPGPWYLAGAASVAQHWMTTARTAFAADRLEGRFDAQTFGGRIETGWRFATPLGALTPYGAVQIQRFHRDGFSESGLSAGGFGLAYGGYDASAVRSELGARAEHIATLSGTALLALQARAAWAHDRVSDPRAMPLFQALPGANFTVNGATPVPNSALASAGGELRFLNGWAVSARFDGEFASRAQTYAGTGMIRYTW